MIRHPFFSTLVFVIIGSLTIGTFYHFRISSPHALAIFGSVVLVLSTMIQCFWPFCKKVVDCLYYLIGGISVAVVPYIATSEFNDFRYGSHAEALRVALTEARGKLSYFESSTPPKDYAELTPEQLGELSNRVLTAQMLQEAVSIVTHPILRGDENWFAVAIEKSLSQETFTDESKYEIPDGVSSRDAECDFFTRFNLIHPIRNHQYWRENMACWFDSQAGEEVEPFITTPTEFRRAMLDIYTAQQVKLTSKLEDITKKIEASPKTSQFQLHMTLMITPMVVILLLSLKWGVAIQYFIKKQSEKKRIEGYS